MKAERAEKVRGNICEANKTPHTKEHGDLIAYMQSSVAR